VLLPNSPGIALPTATSSRSVHGRSYRTGCLPPIASGAGTPWSALRGRPATSSVRPQSRSSRARGRGHCCPAKDQPALAKIIAHFGPEFLDTNGELQRRLLRTIIFSHPQERLWLEQLLHPLIRQKIEERLSIPPALYYIVEIPLLSNKQHYPYLNRTVVVLAEPKIQMERVMLRDNHTAEQVQAIVQAQADEKTYRSLADDLIINNGSLIDLEQAVLALHEKYCVLKARH